MTKLERRHRITVDLIGVRKIPFTNFYIGRPQAFVTVKEHAKSPSSSLLDPGDHLDVTVNSVITLEQPWEWSPGALPPIQTTTSTSR